jgi:hypothetical protein
MTEPVALTLVDSLSEPSDKVKPRQKNSEKCLRYYYRHREELQEKRRQKLMEDPGYVAKQEAKRVAKEAKELAYADAKAEKEAQRLVAKAERDANAKAKREAEKDERRRQKALQLGLVVAPPV